MGAYKLMQETMHDGGDEAVRLIAALLDAAPSEEGAVAVGTGPLEDLINEHGADLDQKVRQSAEFATVRGSVAMERGNLGPKTHDRLARWLPAL